jgi:hypothetical protein
MGIFTCMCVVFGSSVKLDIHIKDSNCFVSDLNHIIFLKCCNLLVFFMHLNHLFGHAVVDVREDS